MKKKQQHNALEQSAKQYAVRKKKVAGPRVSRWWPIHCAHCSLKGKPLLVVVVGKSHQIVFGSIFSFWAILHLPFPVVLLGGSRSWPIIKCLLHDRTTCVFADQSHDLKEEVGDKEAQQAEQGNDWHRNATSTAGFCCETALCSALFSTSCDIPLS
jgi:hypothetical protein